MLFDPRLICFHELYEYYTGNFFTKEFTQKQKGAPSVDYCETFER